MHPQPPPTRPPPPPPSQHGNSKKYKLPAICTRASAQIRKLASIKQPIVEPDLLKLVDLINVSGTPIKQELPKRRIFGKTSPCKETDRFESCGESTPKKKKPLETDPIEKLKNPPDISDPSPVPQTPPGHRTLSKQTSDGQHTITIRELRRKHLCFGCRPPHTQGHPGTLQLRCNTVRHARCAGPATFELKLAGVLLRSWGRPCDSEGLLQACEIVFCRWVVFCFSCFL